MSTLDITWESKINLMINDSKETYLMVGYVNLEKSSL